MIVTKLNYSDVRREPHLLKEIVRSYLVLLVRGGRQGLRYNDDGA